MVRLNADVDNELAKGLHHALVDDGITFAEWLRQQIKSHLLRLERLRAKGGMEDEDRTTPAGLWCLGFDFFRSAEHVLEREGKHIFDPWLYLVSHSIELSLKAFLRSKRCSVQSLKSVGHDLVEVLRLAEDRGIRDAVALEQRHVDAVAVINPWYMEKRFEYRKRGSGSLPVMEDLRSCSKVLLQGTRDVCIKRTG